jgi:acetyltransferase
MDKFFNPSSVVVIGASNSAFNLGASICVVLKYLQFQGEIYVVNRKGEDVCDCPGYKSVLEIPNPVDLAVVITSAKAVPQIFKECGQKGINNIIIESAGFSEEGEAGQKMQDELDAIAVEYGIRYFGPNCLGVLNLDNKFCCFYGIVPGMYDKVFETPGSLSYIIQSGGIGALIIDSFQTDVVNIRKVVSIGNKADVDESDLLEYLAADQQTKLVGMYLENVQNGRKLMETAARIKKPILVFKVGRTTEGARAAMSHTAGMANNDIVFEEACRQSGIVRLKSVEELHTLPKIFTTMPPLTGKRIAIFTNSGAFGGITSDLLVENGFEIPRLSAETQARLQQTGKLFNAANPIDLGPAMDIKQFVDIFDILLASDEIDGLLPIPNVWQTVVIDAILELISLCKKYNKPAAIYVPNAIQRILELRTQYKIPIFESLEEAVRALTVSYQHHMFMKKKA